MVHARSLVGQDGFWIHSQLGLELGHGATSGSTESAGLCATTVQQSAAR